MRVNERIIELSDPADEIQLIPLACIHVGNTNCDLDIFERYINYIKTTPNCYAMGLGDYADAITVTPGGITDPRFTFRSLDLNFATPDLQYGYVREKFGEIRDKLLGLHEGNHDWKLIEKTTHEYVKEMCDSLHVAYLGFSAFTVLKFIAGNRRRRVVIFSGHGQYRGERVGGNVNKLQDLAGMFDADIYITAHTHNIVVFKNDILGLDEKNRPVMYPKIFCSAGSFLRTYEKDRRVYAEKNLSRPKNVGAPILFINPFKGELSAKLP